MNKKVQPSIDENALNLEDQILRLRHRSLIQEHLATVSQLGGDAQAAAWHRSTANMLHRLYEVIWEAST